MVQVLRESTVKARKDYRCPLCGGRISKGERHYTQAVVDGPDMWTYRSHSVCRRLLENAVTPALADDEDWNPDESVFWSEIAGPAGYRRPWSGGAPEPMSGRHRKEQGKE